MHAVVTNGFKSKVRDPIFPFLLFTACRIFLFRLPFLYFSPSNVCSFLWCMATWCPHAQSFTLAWFLKRLYLNVYVALHLPGTCQVFDLYSDSSFLEHFSFLSFHLSNKYLLCGSQTILFQYVCPPHLSSSLYASLDNCPSLSLFFFFKVSIEKGKKRKRYKLCCRNEKCSSSA